MTTIDRQGALHDRAGRYAVKPGANATYDLGDPTPEELGWREDPSEGTVLGDKNGAWAQLHSGGAIDYDVAWIASMRWRDDEPDSSYNIEDNDLAELTDEVQAELDRQNGAGGEDAGQFGLDASRALESARDDVDTWQTAIDEVSGGDDDTTETRLER